ncbi:MAG: hypothetical protein OWS74_01655, partial [Firmicutes bacterium]|nr:hypothetical protein [Bacillota bacterium]
MTRYDLFAIQPYMRLEDYASASSFFHKIDYLLSQADAMRQSDTALAVLPEDIATFLVLQDALPAVRSARTMADAFTRLGLHWLIPLGATLWKFRIRSLRRAFFIYRAPIVWRTWYNTVTTLAQKYRMYIVAGSALLPQNRFRATSSQFEAAGADIYNTSFTADPGGRVPYLTRKVNLVPTQEDVLELSAGRIENALGEWPLTGGVRCATSICYDGFRVAHTDREPQFTPLLPYLDQRGIDIIAQPSANPWPWDEPWRQALGKADDERLRREQWDQESAQSQLHAMQSIRVVINAQLLMNALDIHFDGQ